MKKISFLSILFLTIDQLIKIIVINNMDVYQSIKIISNFFYITYTKNFGAAWSLFEGSRYILILISVLALFIIYKYLSKTKHLKKIEIISFSLLIGGTLGNLIDRIIYGYVIDYLDFIIFGYDFPIFNIADSCIVISAILLIINSFKEDKNANKSR